MTSHLAGSSAVFNIAFGREGKRSYYNTGYSYLFTHPGTNSNEQGSTLLSGRDKVLSLWYSDCFYFLIFKMRKGNERKNH